MNVNKDANAAAELYNLASDPSENNNLAAQYPAIAKRLATIIQQAHQPNKKWPLLPDEF